MASQSQATNTQQPVVESLSGPSRRAVLGGVGAVGAVGVLAACGVTSETPVAAKTESAAGDASVQVPPKSVILASVADVPVGGGYRVLDRELVLTQPEEGEFRGFSHYCPHAGCAVAEFDRGEIICPCHGSRFSAESGDVTQGPALTGLYPVSVAVVGDKIVSTVDDEVVAEGE